MTGCSNNAPAPLTEAQMQADIEKVQSNTKMSQVEKEHTIEIIRAAGKEKTSP